MAYFSRISTIIAACLAVFSCVGAPVTPRATAVVLEPFEGRATELFDDIIEVPDPNSLGGPPLGATQMQSSSGDQLLRERTQAADLVVRVRVTTITSTRQGNGDRWRVGLRPLARLAGDGDFGGDFSVNVEPDGPSAGVLRAFDERLTGTTFVAFVRRFRRQTAPGTNEFHFHLASDTKDEVDSVIAAEALRQVR